MSSHRRHSAKELEMDVDDDDSLCESPAKVDRESDEDTEDASETDMVKQEEEYTEIKEQVYKDKLANLRHQKKLHEQRRHPEYLKHVKKLEEDYEDRQLRNDVQKKLELERVEKEYSEQVKSIREQYERDAKQLKENLICEYTEKLRVLEQDRDSLELTGESPEAKHPVPTRKLRPRANDPLPVTERRRKPSPMRVNYLLTEDEIAEDLKNMNITQGRSTNTSKRVEMSESIPLNEIAAATSCQSDIRVEEGKLFYDKKWFCRGQSIYYQRNESGPKISAMISSINSSEIWIKRASESSKMRITVSQLQRGKYTIAKRNKSF